MQTENRLSEQFTEALKYAAQLHASQMRKRADVPYIAHLLGVASLVLEDGGNEVQAIAALLHDAVEDQGGLKTLEEIRSRFGSDVADIVFALSDSYTEPKPPWQERKENYIRSISSASPAEIRVSLADKVYNARAILRDVRQEGDSAWKKFNGGREGTFWYYEQLIQAFKARGSSYLLDELIRTVDQIKILSVAEFNG